MSNIPTSGSVTIYAVEEKVVIKPVGQRGVDGEGVPEGGTTGQVLAKTSNTDYDTAWVDNDTDGVVSVTGDGVGGTASNVVLTFPTLDDIGAYSNTNPSAFINVAQAPVQSVNGDTGVVVLNADDVGAYSNTNPSAFINVAQASAAAPVQSVTGTQVTGTSADPVINLPTLDQIGAYSNTNPDGFITSAQAPVQSVNGETGVVVLDANDVGAYSNTNPNNFINIAQVPIKTVTGDGVDNTNVGNVVISYPTIDDIGAYSNTNPSAFINVAQAPVQSVNGDTGIVVITADSIGAYLNTNPDSFVNVAQASAAAPIQTVTGTLVTGTASDPVIDIPTLDQVGAYSNTNPSAFINIAQSQAGAPVQSVNGDTGIVVLDASDVGAEVAWTVTNANTGTLTGVNVLWLADTSAARDRTLDVNGVRLQVKDVTGSAGTNNITLTAGVGDTINGNATENVDVDYGWVEYVRTTNNWVTIGGQ